MGESCENIRDTVMLSKRILAYSLQERFRMYFLGYIAFLYSFGCEGFIMARFKTGDLDCLMQGSKYGLIGLLDAATSQLYIVGDLSELLRCTQDSEFLEQVHFFLEQL